MVPCFASRQFHDRFHEAIYFSTVTNRKPEELENGIFHVRFENGLEMFQHIQKTHFTVIESRAYFEASRHILRSLQTAETSTMPFKRYLIDNDPIPVNRPSYLQCGTQYDISWLYPQSKRLTSILIPSLECSNRTIDIMDESAWPTEYELELDESQIKAIRMALTQEISVIQGPPGTGKTYIGYKIVQTLLQNRLVWDPHKSSPILVMCYTNHALDQFLQGIIHHRISSNGKTAAPNIVRVGGRSKNEDIQKHSLLNARRKTVPRHMYQEVCITQKRSITNIASAIPWHYLQKVIQDPVNEIMIGKDGMLRLRPVINPSHYYQLIMLGREKLSNDALSLEEWLGFWDHPNFPAGNSQVLPAPNAEQNEYDAWQKQQYATDESSSERDDNQSSPKNESDEEKDEDNEVEKIHIIGEAEIEESNRRLDDGAYTLLELKEGVEDVGISNDALNERIQQQQQLQKQTSQPEEEELRPVRKSATYINKILHEIRSAGALEPEDERDIRDVTSLNRVWRYRLFNLWIQKHQQNLASTSEKLLALYEKECHNYKVADQNLDHIALEQADVIGMTTTGAAKYQHILHLLKPKIVIVEEAAEVLESHIVSALTAGTQHLILIGDHKQLRPKPNEYDLAKKHKLEVSLFERLLINKLPHATLLIQHRMRPQISSLVRPSIYKELIDHKTVQSYSSIKSCDRNMYFFNHSHPEKVVEHLLSHSNIGEADLVVSLCKHLLKQGYNPSQITILTAYTGQLLCVRDKMPRKEFEGVQVVNVDNFQGEENDIIILSLVRNNKMNSVGFLKEENRVCVALSRARMGFYCFGNFDMLREVVPIWELILQYVESEGCLGSTLPVHCHNHPSFKKNIEKAEDFITYFPEGGCRQACTFRLDCGHQCKRSCHLTDGDHQNYKCKEPCERLCGNAKHPCKSQCFKPCPPCQVFVSKELPNCPYGHEQSMRCHEDPQNVKCLSKCPRRCPKGLHDCPLKCWEGCMPCMYLVTCTMPGCGHEQALECSKNPSMESCYQPCSKKCPNGHECRKRCFEDCGNCQEVVIRLLPKCSHTKRMHCYEDVYDAQCNRKCQKVYDCKHVCRKKCFEECDVLCQEPVVKIFPSCLHTNTIPCYQDPKYATCTKPCEKIKKCGHQCKGQCGELCLLYVCTEPKDLTLPCGHMTTVSCNDYFSEKLKLAISGAYECNQPCTKSLQCGHLCREKCKSPCTTKCKEKVIHQCSKCQHTKKLPCHIKQSGSVICSQPCTTTLPCGHQCPNQCHEECPEVCGKSVVKKCQCGHKHNFKCGDINEICSCTEKCSETLKCGHKCSGTCGECYTKRIHPPCEYDIQVNRFCGHFASLPCYGLTDQCKKPCRLSVCSHNKDPCQHECYRPCTAAKCQEKCVVECTHLKCTQLCSQVCDKPACARSCTKPLQKCRHPCSGTCGEKCIKQCYSVCNKKKFSKDVKGVGKKSSTDDPCVELDCGHIYTVKYLDQRFASRDSLICPLLCPACSKPFVSAHYWKLNRERAQHISQIKEQLLAYQLEVSHTLESKLEEKTKELLKGIKIDNPEAKCAIKLLAKILELYSKVKDHLPQISEKVINFIVDVNNILKKKNGKLSVQIISDIESELFRLSLLTLAEKTVLTSLEKTKMKQPVHSLLQKMDDDRNLRLTYEMYEEYLPAIRKSGVYEVIPVSIPRITKGEWYKCSRAGHIYFAPAQYRGNDRPKCTECSSK